MSVVLSEPLLLPKAVAQRGEARALGGLLGLALVVLAVAVALPVAALLLLSFYGADGAFVGLANFIAYARGPNVLASLSNSLWLSAASAAICVTLAYGYAFALMHSCMPGRGLLRAIALVPLLAPSLLMAISLIYLFGNQGLLKDWLAVLGLGPAYGPFGIIAGSVLWTFPHALLILCTALASGDARLYEAAASLGASRWRIFLTVTLPASRYGLLISYVVVFVLVITDFGVPKVIGGNTQVLATDIYKQVIGQQQLQMGAVVALLLLLPAGLAFWVEQRLRARQSAALSVRAVPYRPSPCKPLDRALLLYCGLIAGALVLVMGVALFASLATYWPYKLQPTLANYNFDLMDGGGWASYVNSIKLACATAVLGAGLSFLTAYLVEKPRRFAAARGLLNAVASLPMAVPGLALGLGYILFFNAAWNPLHFIYGGHPGVVHGGAFLLGRPHHPADRAAPARPRVRAGGRVAGCALLEDLVARAPAGAAADPDPGGRLLLRERADHGLGRRLPLLARNHAGLGGRAGDGRCRRYRPGGRDGLPDLPQRRERPPLAGRPGAAADSKDAALARCIKTEKQ